MSNPFFDHPILNSPYECPLRHWELDAEGQPTQQIVERRRRADFITPIPKPKKRKADAAGQRQIVFDEGKGLSTAKQQYDPTSIINELRQQVDQWRELTNSNLWQVTPETTRLLQHWRHYKFGGVRPFFCQIEAVETAIWLIEVAPHSAGGKRIHELNTTETEGQMIQRVMPDLMGMKNILVLNDEAHHCYREKPQEADDEDLKGDEKKEAEKNNEAARLQTALEALYGHYKKTFKLWEEKGVRVPPCFIVVCQNTAISKLVYDFISGFHRKNEDGTTTLENGRLALFRNFDETTGNPLPCPNTLLIDSEQLEAGNALDDNFRAMATDEIERFRREIIQRTGDARSADNLTDQELLREVMNTVGKHGQLGGATRCVVSVSMLTEGWDANTVTHVLGIRAFGTQLLCEQVIGRALRRQSYDLNEEGLFNVEYADVFGIPFDFTAKPVIAPPQPPRETVQVKAIRPERDALEIRFPRVEGYRVELPEERLTASFNADSILELSPDLVGPSITRNSGIIGEGVDMNLEHLGDIRPSTLLFHVTQRLLYTKWRDPGQEPKLHLFGQLKRMVDDGHGPDNPFHLVVEIKGYRREDAKEKKSTMDTYWVPGVNNLKQYGRWGFAEFTEIYQIEADFKAKVASEFDKMIDGATAPSTSTKTKK